ncbi:YkoP family protein [Paenibacillus tuaregi]|uniref:YkoP family protein n=1 Tax=Paenibacillus tuaregi TaxID=1816681 RepID=UPI000837CBA5|nr:polysaccharide deacetylase [Paenibacillus tuaregi]
MTATYIKNSFQTLWMVWEDLFDVLTKYRSESVRRYGICKLVIRKHQGKPIECYDGQRIDKGEWIGELHLDNRQVLQMVRTLGSDRAGLRTARMFRKAVEQITLDMIGQPELQKIKALTGITLLHRGIIHGMGFEQHPIKARFQRSFFKMYLRLLLRTMHPEGNRRIQAGSEKLSPVMLIISQASLKERAADQAACIPGQEAVS